MIAVQVKKLFHTLLMNWNNLLSSNFPFLRNNCMYWIMVSRAALLILLKLENFITIKFCSLKNFGSLSFRKKNNSYASAKTNDSSATPLSAQVFL